jgi:cyclic pyranopterin phosphate synthase
MIEYPRLTHTTTSGEARMVDVGGKRVMARTAVAVGNIRMHHTTLDAIRENQLKKGDVLSVAKLAGVMAAKRTAELVPLCHTIPLTHVDVSLVLDEALPGIGVEATASTVAQTGVEMEAITAVVIALVTVYDMAKSIDPSMLIGDIKLVSKTKTAL